MATAELAPEDPIARFVERFGPAYRRLAMHAALPLVLTPELLHYLRNAFLRGQVPWVAEADLLLSDLCREVGYEQYAMHPAVRGRLIAELKAQPDGPGRIREIGRLLLQYLRRIEKSSQAPGADSLREQQWAALAYLDSDRVSTEVRDALAALVARLQSRPEDQDALASLAKITQTLAPQLDENPELVALARDITGLLTGDGPHDGPAAIPSPGELADKIGSIFQDWSDRVGQAISPTEEAGGPSFDAKMPEELDKAAALKLVEDLAYFERLLEEAGIQGNGGMMQEAHTEIINLERKFDKLRPRDQLLAALMQERDRYKGFLESTHAQHDTTKSLFYELRILERLISRMADSPPKAPSESAGGGNAKSFDVFLCYSDEDEYKIDSIVAWLEMNRIRCLLPMRERLAGMEGGWPISSSIENCRAMVLILTRHFVESKSLLEEVRLASERGLPRIPIRLEEVLIGKELAYHLMNWPVIDAFPPPLEDHLPKIVERVERALKRPVEEVAPRIPTANGQGQDPVPELARSDKPRVEFQRRIRGDFRSS